MIEMILRFFAIPAGLDCARYGPEGGWGWDPPEGPLVGHQDDVKPHQPQTRYDSHQVDESVPIKTAEDAGLLTSELPGTYSLRSCSFRFASRSATLRNNNKTLTSMTQGARRAVKLRGADAEFVCITR
jgi:hypothetical protein